jgi:hypothetical protein
LFGVRGVMGWLLGKAYLRGGHIHCLIWILQRGSVDVVLDQLVSFSRSYICTIFGDP